jgi:hypothetical protein
MGHKIYKQRGQRRVIMPLYYNPDEEIQKARSRRASDFVSDEDVESHNKKIATLPKDKVTGKVVKPKKSKKKLVTAKVDTKPSGKFSKEGQKKVEAANARNAGRNIMGTAGGENTDSFSTQARGANRKFRGQGTGIKVKKGLEDVQSNLTELLAVIKSEQKAEVQKEIFKSLDGSMDKLRKSKDGALPDMKNPRHPKGKIVSEFPESDGSERQSKEGQATQTRLSNAGRGGKFRHSSETLDTGSLHNAKFRS